MALACWGAINNMFWAVGAGYGTPAGAGEAQRCNIWADVETPGSGCKSGSVNISSLVVTGQGQSSNIWHDSVPLASFAHGDLL